MCCLSEASSHFVVFVCINPDRKPSRKMKRRPSTSSGTEWEQQAQGPNQLLFFYYRNAIAV